MARPAVRARVQLGAPQRCGGLPDRRTHRPRSPRSGRRSTSHGSSARSAQVQEWRTADGGLTSATACGRCAAPRVRNRSGLMGSRRRRPRAAVRVLAGRPHWAALRRPRSTPSTARSAPGASSGGPWTASGLRLAERDLRGQQDRLFELDVDGEGVREPQQRRQAARLRPHPVGDRAREAEGLGAQPRAGGSGCGRRTRRRSGGPRSSRTRHSAVTGGPNAGRLGTDSSPAPRLRFVANPCHTSSPPARAARDEVERLAAAVRREAPPRARSASASSPSSSGRCWMIRSAMCTTPTALNGAPRQQRHVQREREHVRVGGRELVAQREATQRCA